jgi:hypothetical protein
MKWQQGQRIESKVQQIMGFAWFFVTFLFSDVPSRDHFFQQALLYAICTFMLYYTTNMGWKHVL